VALAPGLTRRDPTRLALGALALIGGVALALVAVFDVSSGVEVNDEPVYRWQVEGLLGGHGLVTYPGFVPLALTHRLLGAIGTLGHPDIRLLRLTVLPLLALTVVALFMVSRRLGATSSWAAVAALAVAANPITLSLATSFMTDVVYMGLLALAVLFGLRWLTDGHGRAATVLATTLAIGERQTGLAVVVALALGLAWRARRGRPVTRGDGAWLGALVLIAGGLSLAAGVFRAEPLNSLGSGPASAAAAEVRQLANWTVFAPGVAGFMLLPFLPALVNRARRLGGVHPVAAAAAALVAALAAGATVVFTSPVAGDYLNRLGLGPTAVSRCCGTVLRLGHAPFAVDKPPLLAPWLLALIAASAVAGAVLLVYCLVHPAARAGFSLDERAVFLLVCALLQVLLLAQVGHYDRYFVASLLPLLPLLAAAASRWTRGMAALAAVPILLVFVVLYAAGEQDYLAWQGARDTVARGLRAQVGNDAVDAGWESNMRYSWIPAHEQGRDFDVVNVPIRFHLEFARPGDPRPGRDYSSVAPGRIVYVEGLAPLPP
jgi:hypothetical protein